MRQLFSYIIVFLCLLQKACSIASLRAVLESVTQLRAVQSEPVQRWLSSAVLGARLVSIVQEALALTAVLAYDQHTQVRHVTT